MTVADRPVAATSGPPAPSPAVAPGDEAAAVTARRARIAVGAGFAGSVMIAVSSYVVGATYTPADQAPVSLGGTVPDNQLASLPYDAHTGFRVLYFAGLILMVLSFLYLGRLIIARRPSPDVRMLLVAALLWTVPLLASIPSGSRDVWAYLGQGALLTHHINPYEHGPNAVIGPYSMQVSPTWGQTPSPYGPLFVRLSSLVVQVFGSHVVLAAVTMKLISALGYFAVLAVLVPVSRRFGRRPELVLWLVGLNPLFVVLGVAGGHNDLLSLGLMMVGFWLATNDGSAWRTLAPAAALLLAAADIKAPAAIALAFLPFIWLAHSRRGAQWLAQRRRPRIDALATTIGAVVVTEGVIQLCTQMGYGWLSRLNTAASGTPALSISKSVTLLGNFIRGEKVPTTGNTAALGTVSLAIVGITLLLLWAWSWKLKNVMAYTAIALFTALAMSTTVEPWYYCWPIALGALVAMPMPLIDVIVIFGFTTTLTVFPAGGAILDKNVGMPAAMVCTLLTLAVLRTRWSLMELVSAALPWRRSTPSR